MNRRFSIGEVSKLHNISIQTLRHYDKIGLLKPAYVNEKSKYRYYSAKHFVIIDLIKQCKAMGLSLDEIKGLIENYTSVDSILNIITKQKDIIEEKIRELNSIKNNISFLENRIKTSLNEGLNNVFIKYNDERKFIKYNNTKRYTDEFEIKLSKMIVDMERKYNTHNKELAFLTSYHDFKTNNELNYDNMMISVNEENLYNDGVYNEKQIITLKKGRYVTLNFDDDYKDTKKYYKEIVKYIDENKINVIGDFYEVYIMTRVGIDGKEKSLGQIKILIDDES